MTGAPAPEPEGDVPELEQHAEAVGDAPVLDHPAVDTRITSNTSARIGRPVGGWPMNEPSWVPVATMRIQTVSPSTTRSSIARWKSGNARRREAITALTPSGPGRVVGPKSWCSTRSGEMSSSATSRVARVEALLDQPAHDGLGGQRHGPPFVSDTVLDTVLP